MWQIKTTMGLHNPMVVIKRFFKMITPHFRFELSWGAG